MDYAGFTQKLSSQSAIEGLTSNEVAAIISVLIFFLSSPCVPNSPLSIFLIESVFNYKNLYCRS